MSEADAISKLSDICEKCKRVSDCNEKRMIACSYINSTSVNMETKMDQINIQPIMRETITINTGENALGKVDTFRDELIKKIKEDIYRACGFNKSYM